MSDETKLTGVWLVEYGEYSDRYIGGCYLTEDEANASARANEGRVQFCKIDTLTAEEKRHLRPGECAYNMAMEANGNDAQAWPFWSNPDAHLRVRVNKDGTVVRFAGACWATSPDHAIKILNERRTQWIALGSRIVGTGDKYGWHDAVATAPDAGAGAK